MDFLLNPLKDALGGGTLTLWMIGGGLLAFFVATKVVKFALKATVFAIGGAMLLSAAPWSSEGIDTPVAACATQAVQAAMNTVEDLVSKRVTVKETSADAACNAEGNGLSTGTAKARLRTVYDIPFQEFTVDSTGATPRLDIPDRP
jgi:hypothetical protein